MAGCDKGDPVTTYDAPREPAKPALPAGHPPVGGGQMPGMQAAAAPAGQIQWDVPAAWKQLPGGGEMRFATFAILADDPTVVLTVIPLGAQSGSLVANVNRWEGQLGSPMTPEAELGKVVKRVEANGVKIDVIDLIGPEKDGAQQRMLGAILPHEGRVWFFKAVGPAQKMAGQKDNFDKFIHSIRFGAPAAPATQPVP